MIKVRTLGAAEIVIGKKRITPKSEVTFALALYLCARAGERVPRDRVAEMFWPESDSEKAKHNLRQLLYVLRKSGLHTTEKADSLSVEAAGVECDLTAVLREGWAESATANEIAAAADFLPGLTAHLSEQFAQWRDATSSRVSLQFRRAVLLQIDVAEQEARWADLLGWADMLLHADPMNEAGTFAKARSLAMTGSKADAIAILDQYLDELGDTSPELAKRAYALRRRIAERPAEWGPRIGSEVTLVGRADAMRRISALLEQARSGHGGALVLHGAPGIGKTRLCMELRNASTMTGVRTITLRADPTQAGRPLGLVSTLAHILHDLSGVAGSHPDALSIVRRLCDSTTSDTFNIPSLFANITVAQLSWALGESLRAAASSATLLLHLDDLHNADSSSLDVLIGALAPLHESRVAVLATARSHWLSADDPIVRKWTTVPRLHIPPLSATESELLAASLNRTLPRPLTADQRAYIEKASGGNPLFLRELASHHSRPRATGAPPRTLSSVIAQRCALLTARETRLLRIACLLGNLSTIARLRLLMDARTTSIAEEVEGLERDGLLHLAESGSFSLHECWRDAIESDTSPATRATLAFECAEALGAAPEDSESIDVEWQRGHLYSIASCPREAMACLSRAGDRLLGMGVPHEAASAYARGLSLATELGDLAHFGALLATAQHAAAQYALAVETCRQALSTLERTPHQSLVLRASILVVMTDAEWKVSASASASLNELAQLASDIQLPAAVRNACCYAGIRVTSSHDGRYTRLFADAVTLSGGSAYEEWQGLAALLIFEAEVGSPERVRTLSDAISASELRRLPAHIRSPLLKHCSTARRYIGDFDEAIQLAEQAATLAVSAGLLSEASSTALLIAFGYLDHQRPNEADTWIEQARKWSGASSHDERERSLRHASGRLLLATGRSQECLDFYAPHMPAIRSDASGRRRAVESACVALSAARSGRLEDAEGCLAVLVPAVQDVPPNFNVDFAADALIEVLRLLGRPDDALDVGRTYLARRAIVFARPLAPALKNLTTLAYVQDS